MKLLLDENGSASIWAIMSLSISMIVASFLIYRINKLRVIAEKVIQKIESQNIPLEEK